MTAGAPPALTISTVGEPGVPKQVGHLPRAAFHLAAALGVRPHRLDAHQVFQVAPDLGQHVADAVEEFAHDVRP